MPIHVADLEAELWSDDQPDWMKLLFRWLVSLVFDHSPRRRRTRHRTQVLADGDIVVHDLHDASDKVVIDEGVAIA